MTMEQIKSVDEDQLCATCISRLRDACNFKCMIIKSQRLLMQEGACDEDTLNIKLEHVKPESSFHSDTDDDTANDTADDTKDMLERNVEMEIIEMDEKTPDDDHCYEDVEYLEEEIVTEKVEVEPNDSKLDESDESGPSKRRWPKRLPRNERNKRYMQYTEDDLRKSLEAVRSQKMSTREAAQYYKVPCKTLAAKLKLETDNVPEANKKKRMSVDVKETKCAINGEQKGRRMRTRTPRKTKQHKDEKAESAALQEMKKHKENIHTILLYSNASMVKGQWGGKYACCFCDEKFPKPAELKRHNLDVHEDAHTKAIHVKYVSDLIIKLDITALRCLVCGGKIDSLDLLMNHLKEHNKTIHTDIKNHIIPFKFESDVLQCVACTKQYPFFKTLSEHMNEHYRNYECVNCGRGFINKQSMQTHSYRHQKNVGVFKCTHCPREFDTRHRRSAHVRKTHLHGSKTRKCHACDERFSSSAQVQMHMVKAHGAAPAEYKCDACDKSYSNGGALSLHKRRYHLMLRPHKCAECEMAFFSKMELRSHMVTHTRTKEFQCEICDKRFGTKCCLNQHMRAHFGIKHYRCDWCDLKFAARSKMKLHMLRKHREVV
ncbi:zinc finger protein 2 homolog isoform X3 [Manduca sexta]|uniref:zinc finger protein 2 homolog isoform X3 n=1 Tax=Manduca sexta TaxID=7130 RepID=UPI00188E24C5|nr:zinc finger protein 2 homolog isoform X3 [Manduca sexta]